MFATFGTDEDEDQPAASNESLFGGQWGAEPSNTETPQEDDFYASLGMSNEDADQPAASNESYAQ